MFWSLDRRVISLAFLVENLLHMDEIFDCRMLWQDVFNWSENSWAYISDKSILLRSDEWCFIRFSSWWNSITLGVNFLFFSKFQVKGKILKGIVKLIHGYFFFVFCSQIVTWQNSSFFCHKTSKLKQAFLYFRLQHNIGFTNYICTGLKC